MKHVFITLAGAAVAALTIAGCGGSAPSGTAASTGNRTTHPAAAASSRAASETTDDLKWPGVGAQGRTGTSCDLVPSPAFWSILQPPAIVGTWQGNDPGGALAVQLGVQFVQATDGQGNSVCQINWEDQAGNIGAVALDFIETSSMADIWSGNPPGETNIGSAPIHNYNGTPAGTQYATWIGGCPEGQATCPGGQSDFQVQTPDGSDVLQFIGSGLTVEQVAVLAQIAIDRTPAYKPTGNLNGLGGSN